MCDDAGKDFTTRGIQPVVHQTGMYKREELHESSADLKGVACWKIILLFCRRWLFSRKKGVKKRRKKMVEVIVKPRV